MSACPACGKSYRKGTTVLLLTQPPRNARVCSGCASRGVVIVAPTLAPVVKQVAARDDVVERALRSLRTYARSAQSAADTSTGDATKGFHDGRTEAFEGAITLLRSLKGGAS